jgi:hypothetical protein
MRAPQGPVPCSICMTPSYALHLRVCTRGLAGHVRQSHGTLRVHGLPSGLRAGRHREDDVYRVSSGHLCLGQEACELSSVQRGEFPFLEEAVVRVATSTIALRAHDQLQNVHMTWVQHWHGRPGSLARNWGVMRMRASMRLVAGQGSVAATNGTSECAPCKRGWAQPAAGQSACVSCSIGTYAGDEQSVTCKDSPAVR